MCCVCARAMMYLGHTGKVLGSPKVFVLYCFSNYTNRIMSCTLRTTLIRSGILVVMQPTQIAAHITGSIPTDEREAAAIMQVRARACACSKEGGRGSVHCNGWTGTCTHLCQHKQTGQRAGGRGGHGGVQRY
jgi:hypothetical protein